jgi:hypothetical protein
VPKHGGLVNGKCNKTKSKRGGKKTLDVKLIQFRSFNLRIKDLDYRKIEIHLLWALLEAILRIVLGNE